jgi:hypothetical protein
MKSVNSCVTEHIGKLIFNERETSSGTTAIVMQQLRKYTEVQELLLGSGPRSTMEVLLEVVFLMWSNRGYITQPNEFSL